MASVVHKNGRLILFILRYSGSFIPDSDFQRDPRNRCRVSSYFPLLSSVLIRENRYWLC